MTGQGYFGTTRMVDVSRHGRGSGLFLAGGFDRWKAEGRPVTSDVTKIAPNVFFAEFDASRVASLAEMRRIVETKSSQIADARSPGRFAGTDPEPRPGLRSGHMPGARNVPAPSLSENGELLPLSRLKSVLEDAGLNLSKPVVTSCGSGVTAATITLALQSLGHAKDKLYDGSWSEWGGLADTSVVTGTKVTHERGKRRIETIPVTVTFLEMSAPPAVYPPLPYNRQIAMLRTRNMPLHFYRYLMDRVGRKWHWVNVLRMSDEELADGIRGSDRDIRVLYLDGAPAGFFDIKPHLPEEAELAYFGMMEHAMGQGLGRWFLGAAIEAAWWHGRRSSLYRHARWITRRRFPLPAACFFARPAEKGTGSPMSFGSLRQRDAALMAVA